MVVARRRRRRRPIVPILAVVVTMVVVLLRVADGSSGDDDARLAWFDEVRPVVAESNQLGEALVDLRRAIPSLERPVVTRRLERLSQEADAHVRRADQFDYPGSLRDAHAFLISTLAVRARAVEAMGPAVDAALGGGAVSQAVELLADVGHDLTVGDRTYELFRAEAPDRAGIVVIESTWVPRPEEWEPEELGVWVSTMRSSRAGGPVRDLRVVTVGIDPPPVGRENDVDVFPATKNLRLQVVVANVGNEPAERVVVTASVGLPGGEPDTARQFVDLEPGQRSVVQIGGLQPPVAQPSVVTVRVEPIEGETAITDNSWERRALFR